MNWVFGELSFGELSVGELSLGELSFGDMSGHFRPGLGLSLHAFVCSV